MLKELADYAEKKGLLTEPGFSPKDVRWLIVCGDDGAFLDVVELGDASGGRNRGRTFDACPDLSQGELIAGGEVHSHFLVETAGVVALYQSTDDEKSLKKHEYFLGLLESASGEVPELKAIAACLSDGESLAQVRSRLESLKARATDKVTIRTDSFFPLESNRWHDWWRAQRKSLLAGRGAGGQPMVDFLDGEPAAPAATHPKISGLAGVGGQPSGDVLTGFDKEAFRSYGLEQSANAAMSEDSAHRYAGALNHIIRHHARRLADTLVAHWFDRAPEADPFALLEDGQEEIELQAGAQARRLFESIRRGERPDLAGNAYYAITMSGQAGRVMVRDWMQGSFEELVTNVNAWFDDLEIVARDGRGLAPMPKFFAVLAATVRDPKDLPAPFVAKLWRTAVRDEPIPREALAAGLARAKMHAIQGNVFNHARMGLLKAFHIRNRVKGGGEMSKQLKPRLNEEHPSAAYHCGRLLAVLAALQRSALGDVGAGVIQRYYAAASSTPALVLGRLTKTSQHHLNKLTGGLAHWYEDRIAEVWGRMENAVPRTLTLEDQSLFALGYYQQLAELRTKKKNVTEETEEN